MRINSRNLTLHGVAQAKALLGVLFLTCIGATLAHAQVDTWTNVSTDFSWDDATNWSTLAVPGTTNTALFDTLGAGTIINGATDTAEFIQFGQASETTSPVAGAFTLGSGTITLAGLAGNSGTPIVSYLGSANTALETINSNLIFSAAVGTFFITDSSAGNLTINGNITESSATPWGLSVLPSVGDTVSLGGNNNFSSIGGATFFLAVGSSTTTAYGNLELTSAGSTGVISGAETAGIRQEVFGTKGAIQYDTSGTGITDTSFVFLNNPRSSESAPQLENVAGNNTVATAGNVDLLGAVASSTNNYYIQSDSGTLTVGAVLDNEGNTTTGNGGSEVQYLDGAGSGILNGLTERRAAQTTTPNTIGLVKDGTGTWTLVSGGTFTLQTATTVQGGTLLVDSATFANGAGAINVNNASNENATLGGKGTITSTGGVTVTGGGTINPGDVGVGAANIGQLSLTSNVTVGGATSGTLKFDLDSNNTTSDVLAITGNLTLTSGEATLALNDVGSTVLTPGTTFTLAVYSGTETGTFTGIADDTDTTSGVNTYQVDYGTGSNSAITLDVVAAVPEPRIWALLVIALPALLGTLLWSRRRAASEI